MPLGIEVGLGPDDIVLHGDPAAQKGYRTAPDFWPICCGQTAGRIKTPRGREVDLGPGHIMSHGDPAEAAPARKGHSSPPSFRPMSIVAKR